MNVFERLDATSATVLELLIAGVAFKWDDKTYHVIAHDGDHIATLSNHWVESMICTLRKLGIQRCDYPDYWRPGLDRSKCVGITYGFHDWVDHDKQAEWMDLYFRNPITLN